MDKVKPVEDFVFEGLQTRLQQVFGCLCFYTTSNDRTKILARLTEGEKPEYPFLFITLTNLTHTSDSYNTNQMARRGLRVKMGDGFMRTVRIMPASFDIEIEYVTNKFQGLEQGSVLAFVRRWMFARRCGYLKFDIRYGTLNLWIAPMMNEQVNIPQLDNKVETETAYKTTATLTMRGYISEPVLGTIGIVENLQVNGVTMNTDGSMPNSQFFPFNT
jgi:hypothetical protein